MSGRGGNDNGFTRLVFSWSLDDIFNDSLYLNQVEQIPDTFNSAAHYFGSYNYPLLEETRAELASSLETIQGAPFAEVVSISEFNKEGSLFYDINVDYWRNRFSEGGKDPYRTLPGDVFIISDSKPELISDLQRAGWTWTFASVTNIQGAETENEFLVTGKEKDIQKKVENDISATRFTVKPSKNIDVKEGRHKSFFVVFLMNITTPNRIWSALHMFRNVNIIDRVLSPDYEVEEEDLQMCCTGSISRLTENVGENLLTELNESQTEAIMASLRKMKCNHNPMIELIWGPPGTGKTKTISVLLFILLKMNSRTVVCAPTNVAVNEVAARVLKLVRECEKDALFCSVGEILMFGNKKRLKINSVTEEIYLDYRADELEYCLGPLGWNYYLITMIRFLEDCASDYKVYVENEMMKKEKEHEQDKVDTKQKEESKGHRKVHKKQKEKFKDQHKVHKEQKEKSNQDEFVKVEIKSLVEFVRERFKLIALPLRRCLSILCTHIPNSHLLEENLVNIETLFPYVVYLENLLFRDTVVSDELDKAFTCQVAVEDFPDSPSNTASLPFVRSKCISLLKKLLISLQIANFPNYRDRRAIMDFCYQNASLIFCTASSSFKLFSVPMNTPELLVIDEAAQLKECESCIPLQLPGLRHAILVGDECQLPAMVSSKVSSDAGFGRSLFERLSILGHPKNLLDVQYRMHPSISFFPNSKFYSNRIQDAPLVQQRCYEKKYLDGTMFGPYSFINVVGGKEEMDDDGHSRRNMVEVALVAKMVYNLSKAWDGSRKLSIGVISPYAAQVGAIQDRIGCKYENIEGLSVKIKSVDGFQGGEEDIIIISTVRSNTNGAIGFLSSPKRTNVALTRARHCLWILGNEKTLVKSESIWEALVSDAKDRNSFFNADEDNDMAKVIIHVKEELDQMDDLFNKDSVLFKNARWKVFFSDNFIKSFAKVSTVQKKKSVINLLVKLSSGWRPKKRNVDNNFENSLQIWKQFKVGSLYIVCTIDIKKASNYIQVLKVWDLLPLEEIPKLVKRLDAIFAMYSDLYISRCKEKSLNGDLEIPMTWVSSNNIVQFKDLEADESDEEPSEDVSQKRRYIENSRACESLKLMKFYSLSSVMVKHLLSDRGGEKLDLPFEVTDEQWEIILIPTSTFILGRSGTGKTTILAMKLFQREEQFFSFSRLISDEEYIKNEGNNVSKIDADTNGSEPIVESKKRPLRQLFVTVSPKLCYAVKQHVSGLKRFACNENFSEGNISMNMDDFSLFEDLPDCFLGIGHSNYPLVITFHKFLMMLDGTIGNSFFERFADIRDFLGFKTTNSRSVVLETFLRTKEVTYDRFCSLYWVHFNTQLKKKLDPSRVFTEIISHLKGGLKDGKVYEGKLIREEYVMLSDGRLSTLSDQTRENIYDIFEDYEKLKMERCEFDLADLVNDLHHRLRNANFEGDEMDFVYIDEVQDLTMRQIALFKYICKNVDEGFVFAGDTAQTIARGIDFRFQDIRSLFYNEFLMGSKATRHDGKKGKGYISDILCLKENFRTHDGVLKLAQSVIDLLYHFFGNFVDILDPEKSLICGEDPILLESGEDENAIVKIFGKGGKGNVSENLVGFGAEQVILVRDDCARKEISSYVGKQALVLTIVECKGLEFEDVLLYNFFGSSPLKNQWRVIYRYMDEEGMFDDDCKSYPNFDHARHNILCSELKQLYVAITRTRQRLWICENMEELSRPMFDYWKKKSFVQVKKLDESLAQAMQVASSPEEWKARGIKLFQEDNFVMATMCFEKAGDETWVKWAKAAGMKARADHMRDINPSGARLNLLQAAEIFDSIGKADSAAACFFESGEFEKAGRIYLDKCGENKLNKAGECFTLAGRYDVAAQVYAKGHYFTECLSVCSKGKLFEKGLEYIRGWKQLDKNDYFISHGDEVLGEIEQSFLESCANHYHELKDNKSMMKFVKVFCSIDLIRNFLKNLNCFDELLLVEEELGNYIEASKIAQSRGDVIFEAELIEKAGYFKESSILMLWYVFANSLWVSNNKGWPPKHFPDEDRILDKAISLATKESDTFAEFVSTEVEILRNNESDFSQLIRNLKASRINKSLRGEVLAIRKILDIYLQRNCSKYEWEDEFLKEDSQKHYEDRLLGNCVTIENLAYFWNLWKDKIESIFKYLSLFETVGDNECIRYRDFCLNYFGVKRKIDGINVDYFLMNPAASWVREINDGFLKKNGALVSVNVQQFHIFVRNYFRSELLTVGRKLLVTLESLQNMSVKESMSLFRQSTPLIHIFEVAKYLLESKDLEINNLEFRKLQNILNASTAYFEHVFPLDWQKTLDENMVSLRRTDLSNRLLEETILENVKYRGDLTYGKIGRVVMILLGSGKLSEELYKKILMKFEEVSPWHKFILTIGDLELSGNSYSVPDSSVFKLFGALGETYNANWRVKDYISPHCFFYLIERLLLWASFAREIFFTTKSSFVENIISGDLQIKGPEYFGAGFEYVQCGIFDFVVKVIDQVLFDKTSTTEWMKNSNLNIARYYPHFLLRVVVILCLLCLNNAQHFKLLYYLFGRGDIVSNLPRDFIDILRRKRGRNYNVTASTVAEALIKIGNPLVVVSLSGNRPNFSCGDSIFVPMNAISCKDDVLRILFPMKEIIVPREQVVTAEESKPCNSQKDGQLSVDPSLNSSSVTVLNIKDESENLCNTEINLGPREEILNSWDSLTSEDAPCSLDLAIRAPELQEKVEKTKNLIVSALSSVLRENKNGPNEGVTVLDELQKLSSALDVSEYEGDICDRIELISELLARLKFIRGTSLETLLDQLLMHGQANADDVALKITSSDKDKCIALQSRNDSETNNSGKPGHSENKAKGKNKSRKANKKKGGKKK